MNKFIQDVVRYVANELITNGLANSRTFQRFAVTTNKIYEERVKAEAEKLNATVEQHLGSIATSSSSTAAGPPQPPLRGFPGFVAAFYKEVRKDIMGS